MMKKTMDDDIENVGIMQGFLDSEDESGEDESEDEDEGMSMPEMERSPKSPEILMNTLRGDMRSIDARRDELADLVGYQAATETPEPVLAMLQPILAQQGGGGIGALPQSGPMAQGPQPPMMPPPGVGAPMGGPLPPGGIAEMLGAAGAAPGGAMPPGAMPPSNMPPVEMARGGIVQRFQAGSNRGGVTPAGEDTASDEGNQGAGGRAADDLMQFSPELVEEARRRSSELLAQRPKPTPSLSEAMQARLPEYQKLLGADKGMSQAQMLFDLGQRAFGFAGNVDDAGRPLRGGFLSRLAGATRTLPAAMGKRIDEINKIDRQLNVLALQQGEKDIDQVTGENAELQKRKSALLAEVLRAQARVDARKAGAKDAGPLGRGSKGDILNTFIQLSPLYESGALLPEQERTFLAAVTDYTQEQRVPFTDSETGITKIITYRNALPDYVARALNARRPGSAPVPSASTTTVPGSTSAGGTRPQRTAPNLPVGLNPSNTTSDIFQVASAAPKSTFFDLAATGTGFVPVLVAGIARNVPVDAAGKIAPDFQQSTTMLQSMTNRIVNVLQENPRFPEGERKQILNELGTAPRVFSNRSGYINTIIALDNVMEDLQKKATNIINNERTGVQTRKEQERKLEDISSIRELFGIQQRTITDPGVWATLPPGEYIVVDPRTGFKVLRPKYGPAPR